MNGQLDNFLTQARKIAGSEDVYNIRYDPVIRTMHSTIRVPDRLRKRRLTVIKVSTTKELSRVLRSANAARVRVTVRQGAGEYTMDRQRPISPDGVVVDLSRLGGISVYPEWGFVEAGPAVTERQLNDQIARYGYELPSIGAGISLGTLVSVNASGLLVDPHNGKGSDSILGLQVVLPTGDIIETGSKTLRLSSGPDPTRVFIGNQGLFGIVTRIRYRLVPKPVERAYGVAILPTVEAVGRTILRIYRERLPLPSVLEWVDERLIRIKVRAGLIEPPKHPGNVLLVVTDSDVPGGVAAKKLAPLIEACRLEGATFLKEMAAEKDWMQYWRLRDPATEEMGSRQSRTRSQKEPLWSNTMPNVGLEGFIGENIDVPLPFFLDALKDVEALQHEMERKYPGVQCAFTDHIGTACIGAAIFKPVEWDYERSLRVGRDIRKRFLKLRLKYECSQSECGVFPWNKDWFVGMYGKKQYELLKRLKKALDPNMILNVERIS